MISVEWKIEIYFFVCSKNVLMLCQIIMFVAVQHVELIALNSFHWYDFAVSWLLRDVDGYVEFCLK